MNLNYTAEELAFRDEVRAFLDEKLPADIAAKVKGFRRLSKQDHQRWQKILSEKGWYATHWPEVYGGVNWGPVQKHIWDEESARYGAPRSVPFGVNMVAPVIIKFGTEEQKQRYLPRILSGEDWWCQGYSEPGAGSDLASLKTRAVREGDHYIVNGPTRQHDFLPGAHQHRSEGPGRHFIPADRHEHSGHYRTSDHHPGR